MSKIACPSILAIPALAALALVASCDPRPPSVEQEELATGTVLGHLQSRNQKLTFYASSEDSRGPRFTVTARDGRILASGLSVDELRDRHPELYRVYRSAMAQPFPASPASPIMATSR